MDKTLAHYEILGELGAGGMGVVYRARDTRLEREVAIKALPEEFAADPERLARFEREAKTLASLNHPHIGSIHGLEEVGGRRFLVLELVEGQSLGERLKSGRLPLREALELARQLAEGLEAAHEAGVVHRDLKPGNVHVTPEGQVKVLDFGLAKPMIKSAAAELSLSPTMTYSPTEAGLLLGTAAYMSPEQARGQTVDRRADIWAFGCVLYEMLSGQRAFPGATVTDLLAAVVREEPDWEKLPAPTPRRVRELLRRCLEKEAHFRLRDVGDARIELHEAITRPEAPGAGSRARSAAGVGALAAALLAGGLLASTAWWALGRRPAPQPEVTRVSLATPEGWRAGTVRISPDGRTVVYLAEPESNEDGTLRSHLLAHRLDRAEPVRIPRSDGTRMLTFSPDGRELAFVAPENDQSGRSTIFLWTVGEETPPLALRSWDPSWRQPDWFSGIVWLPDGDLLVIALGTPARIARIPTDGRPAPEPVTVTGVPDAASLTLVSTLPDGGVLGEVSTWEGGYKVDVMHLDPDSGAVEVIVRDGTVPRLSPTGHLLFNRRSQLLAAPFDARSGRTIGPALAVGGNVRSNAYSLRGQLDIARSGNLVHLGGGEVGRRRKLAFVGASGIENWATDQVTADNSRMDVSADGRWVALTVMNRELLFEVWGSDLARPAIRRLAGLPGMDCSNPMLSADASRIAYQCVGETTTRGIYVSPVDGSGTPELVLEQEATTEILDAEAFSPDSRELLVTRGQGELRELLSLSLTGALPAQPEVLLQSGYGGGAQLSPDGSLLAYHSNEAGRWEVFVRGRRPDAALGPAQPVALGRYPAWEPDSGGASRLVLLTPDHRVLAVAVGPGPVIGEPAAIADLTAVMPDIVAGSYASRGRYLVVLRGEDEIPPDRIELVLGFDREIARLASGGR